MQPHLLIFHLNGTVIDVSQSVDSAARRVTQFYLGSLLGVSGSGALVSESDVRAFRAAGGLDDPIALSAALLRVALGAMPAAPPQRFPPQSLSQAAGLLASRKQRLRATTFEVLETALDYPKIAAALAETGGGLDGLATLLGGWRHPLWVGTEADDLALVRRLFLEIYLGRATFSRVYREPSRFYRGAGLVEHERLLLDRETLQALRRSFRGAMAAFSEWPYPLVMHALDNHQIGPLFDALLTSEDVTAQQARAERLGQPSDARKPTPFLLLEAADSLDPGGDRAALVIGNTLDDMRATQRASEQGSRRFEGWALRPSSEPDAGWRSRLKEAGAARVVADRHDLLSALNAVRM